ncbi:MAG: hypothetical protein B6I20_08325 [Bacteroidetes bacterium 4572_117]|nr:MAG: hypothetical protein B6I20_08325 [Bacteroidetes bacterium 4572_117]
MKKILMGIMLIAFAYTTNAQTSKLTGSWLLTKVEDGNKVFEPYFITDFKKGGKMEIMGIEAGSWEYVKKGNKIVMESEMDKDFNGENKILKINKKELIVNKNGAKLFYIKVNQEEINHENAKSNLQGVWKIELENSPEEDWRHEKHFLKFALPDNFISISNENGAVSKYKGTWIYKQKENSIIIIGRLHDLGGKNIIKEISRGHLVFENKKSKFKATKVEIGPNSIERLSFKAEDFPENENTEGNLPWNFEEMVPFMANVKCLKYKEGHLIADLNILEHETLLSKIKTNTEEQTVRYTNFRVTNGDTLQYSENYKGGLSERYNDFFPRFEPWPNRVITNKSVTVPAGTFNCTIVEGFDDDKKIKFWMINNKPGVYAKIIIEGKNVFDDLDYRVLELEEIK